MDDGAPYGRAPRQSGHGENVDLAGVATSGGVNFDVRTVFHLYWRLRLLVLVSDDAPANHRLDGRSTHWLGGRDSVRGRLDRHAHSRLELRSHGRAAVAFRHSPIDGCARPRCEVFHSAFKYPANPRVHAARLR